MDSNSSSESSSDVSHSHSKKESSSYESESDSKSPPFRDEKTNPVDFQLFPPPPPPIENRFLNGQAQAQAQSQANEERNFGLQPRGPIKRTKTVCIL
jgi:hypothetical protein